MLTKFRNLYPQGSILSELIDIDRGVYIVRVSIQVHSITLATGLAGEDTVEKAEDKARNRALQALVLEDGHLSLNLATKITSTTTAQSNYSPKTESLKPISSSKIETPPKIVIPQEELVTATVSPQITAPTIEPSKPAVETKKIPQPEPEVILQSFEPELPVTILDDREDVLEPPLELQPPEDNYAIAQSAISEPVIPEPVTPEPSAPEPPEAFDFNQIRHKIDLEMKRLSWTKEQGRDYLLSTYGKRSRLHLTDDELLEFWHYLETLSN
ncbi:MAG: hypothetical protein AAGA80_13855 [Cyanobacteria bacterium P01_F01_bin.143]